jgi:arginine deiminase
VPLVRLPGVEGGAARSVLAGCWPVSSSKVRQAKAISLEKFLNPSRYAIPPLPNTFFTRDATMCLNNRVIIGSMAFKARVAEALLLKAVFKYHPQIDSEGFYFDGTENRDSEVTIEGGDLLVIREDLVVIGYSERTSAAGIDQSDARDRQPGSGAQFRRRRDSQDPCDHSPGHDFHHGRS